MTTATAPPLLPPPSIDVDELAPLLDDRERVCEIRFGLTPQLSIGCDNPAAWVMSGDCDSCGKRRTRLVCDECKDGMTEIGPVACIECDGQVHITRLEPL